ncbi:MAG: TetR/AcrR family transcriptional regulator [Streptomycetaceae bacterium]|nr:TetR/AcrR family transcriptional regulator [Streptomycetaceae bacterium]
MRADARGNRDQIVDAALQVFREKGIDLPMKEIADRARVGVGTLYRHFPDRDALISAAAHAHLSGLADRAEAALRAEPDAWSALGRFLHECTQDRLGAFAAAVEPALHARVRADPALTPPRTALIELIADMTAQAKADGALRPDVTVADIARLMTVQIYAPDADHAAGLRTTVDLLLDGLRPR